MGTRVIQNFLCCTLVLTFLWNQPVLADVGFRLLDVPDRESESNEHSERINLTVGLWYPTSAKTATEPNTPFGQALALDAPLNEASIHPLALLSHGFSGWLGGHANTALFLAEAGYIVAAPSHTGNHFADMSSPPETWLLDRPRHVSAVLDYLLTEPFTKEAISLDQIAVFGFSAGGHTALSLIGGVPDLHEATNHCNDQPEEFVCAEGMIDRLVSAGIGNLPAQNWGYDSRIKAASIAAPGVAFSYTAESLKQAQVPIQLWSAANDQSVPHASNTARLANRLPQPPELHIIDNANHFSFLLTPCREAFKQANPEEYEIVCGDAPGFNRRDFHQTMNAKILEFFDRSLAISR